MASLLRQIVAGPRARHPEAGLDLCYVTDNIIATSGPSQTYPQRAYRNPLDRLVKFLDSQHEDNWAIWEFRAEGTGYPDNLVYDRIRHYPWPDHHPPPFRLIPIIVASMRNWLSGNDLDADRSHAVEDKAKLAAKVLHALHDKKNNRVVVVHCKAGKGRSGTMACSYLIAECGWTPEQAMARFTERRMRPKFGAGISIPSQLRWISYVDRWNKGGKNYVDRELEILEIHVWGLRDGVKVTVEGFIEEGKKIKVFHTFTKDERQIVQGDAPGGSGMMDMVYEMAGYGQDSATTEQHESADSAEGARNPNPDANVATSPASSDTPTTPDTRRGSIKRISRLINPRSPDKTPREEWPSTSAASSPLTSSPSASSEPEPGGMAVILKPKQPIRIPNSDVNIGIERRNRTPKSVGLTMVTAVAHVWFNAFFEGNGPEQNGVPDETGVFEIDWDALDGIKGSSQKGRRAVDRISVVWRSVKPEAGGEEDVIHEPKVNEPIPQMQPADWKGGNDEDPGKEKHLGLRVQSPDSAAASKASSVIEETLGQGEKKDDGVDDDFEGVRSDTAEGKNDAAERKEADSEQAEDSLKAYAKKLPEP
ncbi:phosphatases II [Poronia punctata]|nr:phosphatases II [Poronia punctata]